MLENMKPPTYKKQTRIELVAAQLDESDRKLFFAALENPEWSAGALSRALKTRGVEVSNSAIQRYRLQKKAGN